MKWGVRKDKDQNYRMVIKKGATLQRLTLTKNERNNSRHVYVSQTKNDNYKYLIEWGNRGYKVDLEVTNDVIIPMYKERMSAFVNAVSKANVNKVAKDISKLKYRNDAKKFLKEWENRSVKEVTEDSYKSFASSLVSSTYNRKIFFKELKERGYNAVIDDNDAGWTNKPIIIFERNKNVKQKSVIEINDKMIDEAIKKVHK